MLPGIEYRSPAFFSCIAKHRWSYNKGTATHSPAQVHDDFQKLADAWDKRVARHGDQARRASARAGPGPWTHANAYTMEFLVRDAYGQLGKSVGTPSAGPVDISSTRHNSENLVSVAALLRQGVPLRARRRQQHSARRKRHTAAGAVNLQKVLARRLKNIRMTRGRMSRADYLAAYRAQLEELRTAGAADDGDEGSGSHNETDPETAYAEKIGNRLSGLSCT